MSRWGKPKAFEIWSGPVRKRLDLVGQVRNLRDPAAHRRSVAAILARKHGPHNSKLHALGTASEWRELTEKECAAVFDAVEWPHGQGRK